MTMRTLWGVVFCITAAACFPASEDPDNPSTRFGEQGVTFKRAEEFGPNVLYPDSQTALISAYLERTPTPIDQYLLVCYRSLQNGVSYDSRSDEQDIETDERASCASQTGGWKLVPFTRSTVGMGEPKAGPAYSTQDHWIYSYADPGDQTQPLLFRFDNVQLAHIRIKLSGLKGGTGYELRIIAGQRLFANRVVLRPPLPREEATEAPAVNFIALADLKTWDRNDAQLKVRAQVARLFSEGRADLAILPGDVSNQAGTSAQYANTYFRTYGDLLNQIPFYPIHGNHDLFPLNLLGDVSQDGWHFFRMFQLPPNPVAESIPHRGPDGRIDQTGYRSFYSFDWGRVHFVALDVPAYESPGFSDYAMGSEQYRWLSKDLEQAQSAAWRVVYFHQPIANPNERSPAMKDLVELLHRKHVSLIVSGHWETPLLGIGQPETPPWLVVPSGGSRSRYYARCPDKFGLVAFSATESSLTGEFINADGEKTGSFRLPRYDATGKLPIGPTSVSSASRWRACEE